MSRNLGRSDCEQCGGPIECEESPRPITEGECGPYFAEYGSWLYVSRAHCAWCRTTYLAWHNRYSRQRQHSSAIEDLSYRGSFNDEPSSTDVPVERCAWVKQRIQENAETLDWELRNHGPGLTEYGDRA